MFCSYDSPLRCFNILVKGNLIKCFIIVDRMSLTVCELGDFCSRLDRVKHRDKSILLPAVMTVSISPSSTMCLWWAIFMGCTSGRAITFRMQLYYHWDISFLLILLAPPLSHCLLTETFASLKVLVCVYVSLWDPLAVIEFDCILYISFGTSHF